MTKFFECFLVGLLCCLGSLTAYADHGFPHVGDPPDCGAPCHIDAATGVMECTPCGTNGIPETPEPTSFLLVAGGLAGAALLRKRRKDKSKEPV
jgi:hypothetical protein